MTGFEAFEHLREAARRIIDDANAKASTTRFVLSGDAGKMTVRFNRRGVRVDLIDGTAIVDSFSELDVAYTRSEDHHVFRIDTSTDPPRFFEGDEEVTADEAMHRVLDSFIARTVVDKMRGKD